MQAASYIAAAISKEVGSHRGPLSRTAGETDSDDEDMPNVSPGVRRTSSLYLGLQRYIFLRYDTYPNTFVTIRYTIRYIT